jgi:rhamnosyltransferase
VPRRISHHSAQRRYYITRNRIWTLDKYGHIRAGVFMHHFRLLFMDTLYILLFETNKWKKVQAFVRGVVDGFSGRLGRRDI